MLSTETNQRITSQSVGISAPSKPLATVINRMGVAVGAGWVKATDGQQIVKARSLILETEPTDFFGQNSKNWRVELMNSPIGQGVFYLGDKLDGMTGTKSLANGEKGNYYPIAALAAIAQLLPKDQPHRVHTVEVACSIPTQAMKGQLTSLKGHHLVNVNGASVQINITRVVAQPEGLGTCAQIAHLQAVKGAQPPVLLFLILGLPTPRSQDLMKKTPC